MFKVRCIVALAVFYIFEQIDSLVTLPKVEDNNIIKAESVIRATINTLFSNIGLKNVRDKPRLKQYSLVHNYFVSLTLQDYNSLKEIAKLTRIDKARVVNDTVDYIDLLNEILDEENVEKLQSIVTDVDLKTVYDLQEKLDYLKRFYNEETRDKNTELNREVLKILQQEESLDLNVTSKAPNFYTGNDYLLDDIPTWHEDEEPFTSGRRLFNSKRTKIKKFPFMASIQIFSKFQCGGSIIKSDLVITAASCLQLAWNNRFYRENPLFLSVRVGSSFYEVGGENIGVMEVYFHPSYNPKNLHHNIAILRLIRKIRLKKKQVKKILLDTEEHGLSYNVRGVQIVGWGARTRANVLHGPWEDKLSYATLHLYSLADCQDVYSKEYVTKQHFCAGSVSVGSGACNRDVGDPGIVSGKLTGIVSFGTPVCGTPDAPTVFTKVGFYYDWIEEILDQNAPSARHRTTTPIPTYPYELQDRIYNAWFISPISTYKGFDITGTTPTPHARLLREEDREQFKQFLKTMFDSAEAKEYLNKMTKPEDTPEQKQEVRMPLKEHNVSTPAMQIPVIQQLVAQKPVFSPILQNPIKQPIVQQSVPKNLIPQPPQSDIKLQKFDEPPNIIELQEFSSTQKLDTESAIQQPKKKNKQTVKGKKLKKNGVKKIKIKKNKPMEQHPSMPETSLPQINEQPMIQQSVSDTPILKQLIMQKPVLQPIVQEVFEEMQQKLTLESKVTEKITPESKFTAKIIEDITLFPTYGEKESGENSAEYENSTVFVPFNSNGSNFYEEMGSTLSPDSEIEEDLDKDDTKPSELRMGEYLATFAVPSDMVIKKTTTTSLSPDLAMEIDSTSDENADKNNELFIRIPHSDEENVIQDGASVKKEKHVETDTFIFTTETPSFPKTYYTTNQNPKLQKKILKQSENMNDKIDDTQLHLLYFSDNEMNKKLKSINNINIYRSRNTSDDLIVRQYNNLTEHSISNLDIRKLMNDDLLMEILSEEFETGLKSIEASEAPKL